MRFLSSIVLTLFTTLLLAQAAPIPKQGEVLSLQVKRDARSPVYHIHTSGISKHPDDLLTEDGRVHLSDDSLSRKTVGHDDQELHTSKKRAHSGLASSTRHKNQLPNLETRFFRQKWTQFKNKFLGPKRVKEGKGKVNLGRRNIETRFFREKLTQLKNHISAKAGRMKEKIKDKFRKGGTNRG